MFILISPAKKQDFNPEPRALASTQATLSDETRQLVEWLKVKTPEALQLLMHISPDLATLNARRFKQFDPSWQNNEQKQALFAFQGEVYRFLSASTLDHSGIEFSQQHLGILSGLYGLLRPLDLIQPYRLEMKTPLMNSKGKNLYAFWGEKITEVLSERVKHSGSNIVINLASQEYFKAIQPKLLSVPVLTIDFKSERNGAFKTIGVMAKRARGMMARRICAQQLTEVNQLKLFKEAGYHFKETLSSEFHWVFVTKS